MNQERGTCDKWRAVQKEVLNLPPKLEVTGQCLFPTSGYRVSLGPAADQGSDPLIRVLERLVSTPSGPVPDVITTIDVAYSEKPERKYNWVRIVPENVRIKVEHVM